MRRFAILAALSLIAATCAGGSGSTPVVTGTTPGSDVVVGDTAPPDTPPPPPTCPATTPITAPDGSNPKIEFLSGDAGLASVSISQATFECATHVVVVSDADLDRIAVATVLAVSLGAPLLIGSNETTGLLAFETERLAPEQMIAVGDDFAVAAPEWTAIVTLTGDTVGLAAEINSLIGVVATLPLPTEKGAATLVATINAIGSGSGLMPPAPPPPPATDSSAATSTTTTAEPAPEPDTAVPGLTAGSGSTGVALLVDGGQPAAALAAFAAAEASGAVVALIDDKDLRRVAEAGRALQSVPGGPGAIHVFGDVAPEARWQLDVIRTADELPGGGFLVLPRLFVALYGNPLTEALGVLGEQGPEDGAVRIRSIADGFAASGAPLLPTFEIITTVAAGGAGSDGDYSNEMPPDVLQPFIDVAEQQGMYVILDLQPGRSDFLSQAMEYEQQLLNPHVGLALDPEWRLKPDEVHLNQVGRVDAAEVNRVVEWLAGLVRENNLPQKVLVLHQFRLFMLENRELIQAPPELQVIIQMDGQGAQTNKYVTWDIITQGWQEMPWAWGWKNFFDEDSPGPVSPGEILQLVPTVVFTSFQ